MTPPATLQAVHTTLPENNLDQLRAVAVSCVFFSHLAGCLAPETPFVRWLGQAGVLAFFVHTALVLMSSLERDGAPERSGWVSRFYLRRAFRIYPLAWVVIATVLLLRVPPGSLATTFEPVPVRAALVNFALVQNLARTASVLAPLWTLPLELQMYLLLPLCFLLARRASRAWLAGALVASIALDVFYLWGIRPAHEIPQLSRLNLIEFVPCFLMGVLAYASLRRRRADARLLPTWTWLPILLADIALVAPWWNHGYNFIARVVFCGVIGLAIPLVREAPRSLLTRAAHTIAVYSYGIYLIHLLAMRVGFGVLRDSPVPVQLLATFAVLTASCYAGYHLIERPGIALGQRLLGARRQPIPLEATAPAP